MWLRVSYRKLQEGLGDMRLRGRWVARAADVTERQIGSRRKKRSERSAHARWSLFGGQLMAETVTVLKQEWSCRLLAPLQVLPSYSTNHVDILFPFCDCRHTTLRLFMSPLT